MKIEEESGKLQKSDLPSPALVFNSLLMLIINLLATGALDKLTRLAYSSNTGIEVFVVIVLVNSQLEPL